MDDEWVILDTETDGLYAPIHVVEVAAQIMQGMSPVGEPFQAFINHNVPIPAAAFSVHGYSQDFLYRNGEDPAKVYFNLQAYIGTRPITAHYLAFDWDNALLPEWRRLGIANIGCKGLCSWRLSRRTIFESHSHKLDCLRDGFGLACSRPHSALGDVESLVDLFCRILAPRLIKAGICKYEDMLAFSMACPIERCRRLIRGENLEGVEHNTISVLKDVNKARQAADARAVDLIDLLKSQYYQVGDISFLLSRHDIIPEQPDINIVDRVFLFTGKMAWGTRPQVEPLLLSLGGKLSKSQTVTDDIDYLVLGEDNELGWSRRLGSKLPRAIEILLMRPNSKLKIILETDFIAAINKQQEATASL
jgi:DNA polymerase-3 subunit epsilon